MKPCIKCGEVKSLDKFSKHSRMRDGHLNKCKSCCIEYSRQHRKENQEYYQRFEKERSSNPERKLEMLERVKRYRNKHPKRDSANRKLNYEIRMGRLVPEPCFICGDKGVGHHPDYDRPLDVTWLCPTHHRQLHTEFARKEDGYRATTD